MAPVQQRQLASRDAVAEYLGVPRKTLDQWAYRGTGPRFVRVGKHVRYRWSDVEQWLESQESGGAA
jgi:excisionase family DNA binding protein